METSDVPIKVDRWVGFGNDKDPGPDEEQELIVTAEAFEHRIMGPFKPVHGVNLFTKQVISEHVSVFALLHVQKLLVLSWIT